MINHVNRLCLLGERQGDNEIMARQYIEQVLRLLKTSHVLKKFQACIPITKSHQLIVDGKIVPSEPTSFVSGLIDLQSEIFSSIDVTRSQNKAIINFNPKCKEAISKATFYQNPSLAVKTCDVARIKNAKSINGFINITKHKYESANILVGNLINPQIIIFTHYDSIGTGAVDNASGVAVLLKLIEIFPEVKKTALCIFSGNEELSFDKPVYWGHGYREFEKKHINLLKAAKKILVIDSVGHAKPQFMRSEKLVCMGLPLINIKLLLNKTCALSADFDKLMTFYHSPMDTPQQIKELYMDQTLEKLSIYLNLKNANQS